MWLILGGEGQLGRCLASALETASVDHVVAGRADVDITDRRSVEAAFVRHAPSVVVNTAAWTNVDLAETEEHAAHLVNCEGARTVASAAKASGAILVHVSTDYVFPGTSSLPVGELDTCSPVNAYGRTKLAGEMAVRETHPDGSLVVRTAWLYSRFGHNFARTIVRRALAGQASRVVDDQHGQPTCAIDLSRHILELVGAGAAAGTYHGTNSGRTTWFGFAESIYTLAGADPALVSPVPSSEYPTPAARPAFSVLGHDATVAAGVTGMRPWLEALATELPRIIDAEREGEKS